MFLCLLKRTLLTIHLNPRHFRPKLREMMVLGVILYSEEEKGWKLDIGYENTELYCSQSNCQ